MIAKPDEATIDLQRADVHDLEALAALMNAAYGSAGEGAGWTNVKDFLVGDRTSTSARPGAKPRVRCLSTPHPRER